MCLNWWYQLYLEDKYPKAKKFLEDTGMNIDEALEYFEKMEE